MKIYRQGLCIKTLLLLITACIPKVQYACCLQADVSGVTDTVYQDTKINTLAHTWILHPRATLWSYQSQNFSLHLQATRSRDLPSGQEEWQNYSPYQLSWNRDLPLIGTGAGVLLSALAIHETKPSLALHQIHALDHTTIWAIDQGAVYQFSPSINRLSDVALVSSAVVPWLYLADKRTRSDFQRIALIQAETFLATYAITALTKSSTHRTRPYAYHPEVPIEQKLSLKTTASFFSGHTSTSAAMSYFMATTFSQYYPDSRLKPVVWTYAAAWPAMTGYMRYKAGYHYPTDIVIGYLIGAASGILVPKLHQRIVQKPARGKAMRSTGR